MSLLARLAVACVIALASLASCSSANRGSDALRARVGGLVAQLRSPSSAVTGSVRVYDYRDGVQVQLYVNNLIPGQYRIAFHETPNCRSPNLFSAGPALGASGVDEAGRRSSARVSRERGREPDRLRRLRSRRVHGASAVVARQIRRDPLGHERERGVSRPAQQSRRVRRVRMDRVRSTRGNAMGLLDRPQDSRHRRAVESLHRVRRRARMRARRREPRVHVRQRRPEGPRDQARGRLSRRRRSCVAT